MKWLFDVFSRRRGAADPKIAPVPPTFRARVLMLCRDTFQTPHAGNYEGEFWTEMHRRLTYLQGASPLAPDAGPRNEAEDAMYFLHTCSSEQFFDFIEYIFQLKMFWRFRDRAAEMVKSINDFLRLDDLPYHLTDLVETEREDTSQGRRGTVIEVTANPKVILREHQVVHNTAIAPALALLTRSEFVHANAEFLEALEDYRRGDLGDCLTKCNSAFESSLKVICDKRRWNYAQHDTTSTLVTTVVKGAGLPSFFEQPLVLVGTIRNRLSKSHGAGTQPKNVSRATAEFAVNATAAAILLLVGETL